MKLESRTARSVAVAAFVALTGPPVGSLGVLLVMAARSFLGDTDSNGSIGLVELFNAVAIFALFGYVLGGLPAVLSAAWLGLRTYRNGGFGYGEAVLTAIAATVCFATLFLARNDWDPFLGALSLVVLTVPSALVVRRLLGRTGWLAGDR